MHFPADRDLNYFAQMIAERKSPRFSGGQRYTVWELPNGRANEALDCRVYAYAALSGMLYFGMRLNRRAEEVGAIYTRHEGDVGANGEVIDAEVIAEIAAEVAPEVITPGRPDPPKKRSIASRLA
jgi:phage terminase large subunit GpA-like protein